jgi:hypothetical protein
MAEQETQLTEPQMNTLYQIMANTPSIALPQGGMGYLRRPETIAQVFEVMDSMAAMLRTVMQSEQEAREELIKRDHTMAIAGGFLRDLLAAGQPPIQRLETE